MIPFYVEGFVDLIIAVIIGAGVVGAPLFALWRSVYLEARLLRGYLVAVDNALRTVTVSGTGVLTGYAQNQLAVAQRIAHAAVTTVPGRTSVDPAPPSMDAAF